MKGILQFMQKELDTQWINESASLKRLISQFVKKPFLRLVAALILSEAYVGEVFVVTCGGFLWGTVSEAEFLFCEGQRWGLKFLLWVQIFCCVNS